jgi:hypothetical protein
LAWIYITLVERVINTEVVLVNGLLEEEFIKTRPNPLPD